MSTYPPNKPLIGAVAALFLGAGVFTATSLAAKEQLSDLTLANIEAMTFNPDDPQSQTTWTCDGWWGDCKAECTHCGIKIEADGSLKGSHSH